MGVFSIVWAVIVGFVVGLIARWIMPGVDQMGFWLTTALGIGGSLVGGIVSSLIFRPGDGKFHPAGFVMSLIGALVLLWAWRHFVK